MNNYNRVEQLKDIIEKLEPIYSDLIVNHNADCYCEYCKNDFQITEHIGKALHDAKLMLDVIESLTVEGEGKQV